MNNSLKVLESEISALKLQLAQKELELTELKNENKSAYNSGSLTPNEISRYSRQVILPNIKVKGQLSLKNGKVTIVGAGGLGCPAALYLAAAGVGRLRIIDSDSVELSNLHRQILHGDSSIGVPKSHSALFALSRVNSCVKVEPVQVQLNSSNVFDVIKSDDDVVIDCTDNVASRYLVNDACVMQKIPLISGSALQMEGQLTVYNYGEGPCYRCLFPVPPPPETVTSCGDGGVLGPIPGCIGVLQALEAIKILTSTPDVLSGRMLLFDGSNTTFRNVQLRKRNPKCAVCGDEPTVTKLMDYEQFCRSNAHDKGDMIDLLSCDDRITVQDYDEIVKKKISHILLDVRPETEFEMCRLPNSINVPFTEIQKNQHTDRIKHATGLTNCTAYVVCRRGNDSQRAVQILKEQFHDVKFKDIVGGLHAYSANINPTFPVY